MQQSCPVTAMAFFATPGEGNCRMPLFLQIGGTGKIVPLKGKECREPYLALPSGIPPEGCEDSGSAERGRDSESHPGAMEELSMVGRRDDDPADVEPGRT